MSGWTDVADLKAQLKKLWDRGDILAAAVTGDALFPKRLTLKTPTSVQMIEQFDDVRRWIAELKSATPYRVTWREFLHRQLGVNTIPEAVWLDTLDDAVAALNKQRDYARFGKIIEQTHRQQAVLLPWLAKRPLSALALFDAWPRLLHIVTWLQQHPRPNVFLRQVDLPGVHSKFIEAHRGVLSELLDIALTANQIDATASGVSQFAKRYGFRDKPALIRMRLLDDSLIRSPFGEDVTLTAERFSQLNLTEARVFITENETNFLAFPSLKNSLVLFGKGYGFDMLSDAEWLRHRPIYYWGDIDTHGFAILDQLRHRFAHVESLLMDRATLLEHETQWGEEAKQTSRDLLHLHADEQALYNDLRDNRIRANLRLEQERVEYAWLIKRLNAILHKEAY